MCKEKSASKQKVGLACGWTFEATFKFLNPGVSVRGSSLLSSATRVCSPLDADASSGTTKTRRKMCRKKKTTFQRQTGKMRLGERKKKTSIAKDTRTATPQTIIPTPCCCNIESRLCPYYVHGYKRRVKASAVLHKSRRCLCSSLV